MKRRPLLFVRANIARQLLPLFALGACVTDDAVLISSGMAGAGAAAGAGGGAGAGAGAAAGAAAGAGAGAGGGAAAWAGAGGGGAGAAAGAGGSAGPLCGAPPPGGFLASCTPQDKAARLAVAEKEPIILPRFVGGLDLGGPTGKGLYASQAEKGFVRPPFDRGAIHYPGADVALCAPTSVANGVEHWGSHLALGAGPNGAAISFGGILDVGLIGPKQTLIFSSRPGSIYSKDGLHLYHIAKGAPVDRDGVPLELAWQSDPSVPSTFDELYDATIYTSAPWVRPLPGVVDGGPQTSCRTHEECFLTVDKSQAVFATVRAGFSFVVDTTAAPNTPTDIYIDSILTNRRFPHSAGFASLGLDGAAASLDRPGVGALGGMCSITTASSFADLIVSCVAITGEDAVDAQQVQSLTWGMAADLDGFTLSDGPSRVRVDRASLGDLDYVAPQESPAPADRVSGFTVDLLALIRDDLADPTNPGTSPLDYHGGHRIQYETALLIQERLQALRTDICPAAPCPNGTAPLRALGDKACLKPTTVGGVKKFALGCTGVEGVSDVPAPTPQQQQHSIGGLMTVTPAINICSTSGCGWVTMAQVRDQLVGTWASPLPPELFDVGYYERAYGMAAVRYLRAAVNHQATADEVHAAIVDPDWVSFTHVGLPPGDATFHYVERDHASGNDAPPALTLSSVSDTFEKTRIGTARRLSRAERLVYRALRDPSSTEPIGGPEADGGLLTNLFGSPVLNAVWGAAPTCATANGGCAVIAPRAPDGTMAVDELGRPLLARYRGGILASSAFARGATDLKLLGTDECDGVAKVSLPQRTDPYSPATATADLLQGIAFWEHAHTLDIPGGRTVSVLRFPGETVSYDVGIDVTSTGTRVRSIEAQAFFGRVFLCRDSATNELLSSRSYTSLGEILAWMSAHPTATTSCGVATRSVNGTPAFVDALEAGITLRLDSTAKRVVGAILWDTAP